MNAPYIDRRRTERASLALADVKERETQTNLNGFAFRILTKRYGSLLGPEYDIAIGERAFRIGELTKTMLEDGTPPEEIDMLEINPDEEDDD